VCSAATRCLGLESGAAFSGRWANAARRTGRQVEVLRATGAAPIGSMSGAARLAADKGKLSRSSR